ncbi:LAMI_0F04170g1_1 [Lachancea mirantina]|uniref:LAMI_0F04170g1_1 n=1 Tax=Lachancea mirantina TaxID=1230905 RepID=A0A1G4JXQ6_9SACH|nr:LAMI_0F04170g1_1 [Lachancea mirantina]
MNVSNDISNVGWSEEAPLPVDLSNDSFMKEFKETCESMYSGIDVDFRPTEDLTNAILNQTGPDAFQYQSEKISGQPMQFTTPSSSISPGDMQSDGLENVSGRSLSKGVGNNRGSNAFNESEDLTEEQVLERKKAQNRAAQKAFRERKEAKLREAEEKLRESETSRKALQDELEKLRRENVNLLSQKSKNTHSGSHGETFTQGKFTFPTESEFMASLVSEGVHGVNIPATKESYMHDGTKLLTVPATWEYLHEISQERNFDVYYVMQHLQGNEVCHGHGPAYAKCLIDQLVERCT